MSGNEHFVSADSEGYFYCRAVDCYLNVKKEQHVCGSGCPYYTGKADIAKGEFVCRYIRIPVNSPKLRDVIAYCPVQCQFEFPVIAKWTDQAKGWIVEFNKKD